MWITNIQNLHAWLYAVLAVYLVKNSVQTDGQCATL